MSPGSTCGTRARGAIPAASAGAHEVGREPQVDGTVLHVDDEEVEAGRGHDLHQHRAAGEVHHAHHELAALQLSPYLIVGVHALPPWVLNPGPGILGLEIRILNLASVIVTCGRSRVPDRRCRERAPSGRGGNSPLFPRAQPQVARAISAGNPTRRDDGRRAVLLDDRRALERDVDGAGARARRPRRSPALRRTTRRASQSPHPRPTPPLARAEGPAGLRVTPTALVRMFTTSTAPSGSACP